MEKLNKRTFEQSKSELTTKCGTAGLQDRTTSDPETSRQSEIRLFLNATDSVTAPSSPVGDIHASIIVGDIPGIS